MKKNPQMRDNLFVTIQTNICYAKATPIFKGSAGYLGMFSRALFPSLQKYKIPFFDHLHHSNGSSTLKAPWLGAGTASARNHRHFTSRTFWCFPLRFSFSLQIIQDVCVLPFKTREKPQQYFPCKPKSFTCANCQSRQKSFDHSQTP